MVSNYPIVTVSYQEDGVTSANIHSKKNFLFPSTLRGFPTETGLAESRQCSLLPFASGPRSGFLDKLGIVTSCDQMLLPNVTRKFQETVFFAKMFSPLPCHNDHF